MGTGIRVTERKDLMVGNWKMNATHLEAIQIIQKLSYRLDINDYDRVDVVVAPPFTALRSRSSTTRTAPTISAFFARPSPPIVSRCSVCSLTWTSSNSASHEPAW
jgi:hypothetical protein